MKTIQKQVKEIKDLKAVSKTYKADDGSEYGYYELRLYYNDKDYVVMSPNFKQDKKTIKELIECGAIELMNR